MRGAHYTAQEFEMKEGEGVLDDHAVAFELFAKELGVRIFVGLTFPAVRRFGQKSSRSFSPPSRRGKPTGASKLQCARPPARLSIHAESTLLIRRIVLYIFEHMKALIVELDNEMAAKLERVAPGRSRQRSDFIRNAIRRALWEIEEQATAEAYRHQPDSEDAYFNPDVWEPAPNRSRIRRKRARR
jgi:Arc/MetJ-type ribon-helix-helix transcriptional regulator